MIYILSFILFWSSPTTLTINYDCPVQCYAIYNNGEYNVILDEKNTKLLIAGTDYALAAKPGAKVTIVTDNGKVLGVYFVPNRFIYLPIVRNK